MSRRGLIRVSTSALPTALPYAARGTTWWGRRTRRLAAGTVLAAAIGGFLAKSALKIAVVRVVIALLRVAAHRWAGNPVVTPPTLAAAAIAGIAFAVAIAATITGFVRLRTRLGAPVLSLLHRSRLQRHLDRAIRVRR